MTETVNTEAVVEHICRVSRPLTSKVEYPRQLLASPSRDYGAWPISMKKWVAVFSPVVPQLFEEDADLGDRWWSPAHEQHLALRIGDDRRGEPFQP